jgi:hypothetical protein
MRIRGEEQHRTGDVDRFANPSQRNLRQGRLSHGALGLQHRGKLCVDETRQ